MPLLGIFRQALVMPFHGTGQGSITQLLAPLLEHGDGEVRARACNVVGNLCRFNTAFLEPILAAGIIPLLIDRCRDFHLAARKFACFAIGNAGAAPKMLSYLGCGRVTCRT